MLAWYLSGYPRLGTERGHPTFTLFILESMAYWRHRWRDRMATFLSIAPKRTVRESNLQHGERRTRASRDKMQEHFKRLLWRKNQPRIRFIMAKMMEESAMPELHGYSARIALRISRSPERLHVPPGQLSMSISSFRSPTKPDAAFHHRRCFCYMERQHPEDHRPSHL